MSYAEELAVSGHNYAACHVCEAKPHEPCIATGRFEGGARGDLMMPHRNRMLLGGVKPWGYAR